MFFYENIYRYYFPQIAFKKPKNEKKSKWCILHKQQNFLLPCLYDFPSNVQFISILLLYLLLNFASFLFDIEDCFIKSIKYTTYWVLQPLFYCRPWTMQEKKREKERNSFVITYCHLKINNGAVIRGNWMSFPIRYGENVILECK